MPRIPFLRFEIGFESLESLSNGLNLESKALSPFRMVKICIRMLRIPFEWLECAFECLETLSKGLNLDLKSSNPFRMIRNWI